MTQTLEYMIDVMTRAKAGEQVQGNDRKDPNYWFDTSSPVWAWNNYNYRIKPREPRVIWVPEYDNGELGDSLRVLKQYIPDDLRPIKFVEVLGDER